MDAILLEQNSSGVPRGSRTCNVHLCLSSDVYFVSHEYSVAKVDWKFVIFVVNFPS